MTGKDLVEYIKKHQLEEAEIVISPEEPLQFVVTIPSDKVSDERELVYDFTRDFVFMHYLAIEEMTYEEAREYRCIF